MRLVRPVICIALAVAAAAQPLAAATPDELDTVRRECIAVVRDTQQREQAALTIAREIDLLTRDADGRRRGLDESRPQQAHLLEALVHIARHPPDDRTPVAGSPIDRVRSQLLMQASAPALNALTRGLAGEITRIASLRQRAAAKQEELNAARLALAAERQRLTQATWRRADVTRQLVPDDPSVPGRLARIGRETSLGDLIKSADAAAERRDKDLTARVRAATKKTTADIAGSADPTRPREVHALAPSPDDAPQALLVPPVAGTVSRRFGETGATDAQLAGVSLSALNGAAVVAPFDGQVVYTGTLRDLGLVLIMRHLGGYHSLLAGLDRVDVRLDQWVVAGEPLGAMPEAVADAPGSVLYFELRRDGRPVDPQPWLAARDDGRGDLNGDQKVRQ